MRFRLPIPKESWRTFAIEVGSDDNANLKKELSWVWREVLTRRRRTQGLILFGFMLVGGLAELLTVGAVIPLLAIFGSSDSEPTSRIAILVSDLGLGPEDVSLTTVGAIFCTIALATAMVRIFLAWAGQRYVFQIGYDVGVALYDRMLHQPFSFHVRVSSSRIIASIESIQKLLTSMLMPMLQAAIAIVIGSFLIVGLIVVSPLATLTAMTGFATIYIFLSMVTQGRLRRNAHTIEMMNRMRVQAVQEGLGGICDVLLDNAQAAYVAKFSKIDLRLRSAQSANALIAVAPRFIAEAAGMILLVGLALLLHREQGGIAASLPILGALALGAQRLLPLVQQAYFGWANLLSAQGMLLGITGLLRYPLPHPAGERELARLDSTIELKSVDFNYSREKRQTIDAVCLIIPKGARVGFVGKSGSGKTTLLNLIMGLLQPSSGQILIDGVALEPTNLGSWQKQVAHVPQSIFLIDGPISQNVALGVDVQNVDHSRLRHACQQAEIADFVEGLADGYDTTVGERGVRLSGGQIQRIGLARALYKNSSVLILDEATSALDDATEANIIDAVERLGRDYTILIVAHRTTSLRRCDIVFKLEGGRLVQSGSPADILGPTPAKLSESVRTADAGP